MELVLVTETKQQSQLIITMTFIIITSFVIAGLAVLVTEELHNHEI